MAEKNITIEDIAKALNVSKTTVSRAISGKGRISQETKERVQRYIERHGYKPNIIAKSLAESRSYNIGFVMPRDYAITELSFYQKCLWGISQTAAEADYDVMVALVSPEDFSGLNRIIENGKVDGLVLGRTSLVNRTEQFLMSKNIPFVTVGSSVDNSVIQVDNDHEGACQELTTRLLRQGIRNLAIIGADTEYIVNRNRYHGYIKALENADLMIHPEWIHLNCTKVVDVEKAVECCMEDGTECILCMDDEICVRVLNKLNRDMVRIPEDMMIASFYNSHTLGSNPVKITAINFDETSLGEMAAKTLIEQINQREPAKKVLLGYEISIQESTKKEKKNG